MQNNIKCLSAEMHNQQGVFLIKSEQDSLPFWYYILVPNSKLAVFKGLTNFLPLNLPLFEYGSIINSDSGENPPPALMAQIKNGDFTSSSDSEVFCIISQDNNGREFYTYLDVPYYLVTKFKDKYQKHEEIEYTEYGEILYSDWGRPTPEVTEMMTKEYGIDQPTFQVIN